MGQTRAAQPQREQQVPDTVVRLGGWLFRHRTSLPVPLIVLLVIVPPTTTAVTGFLWPGIVVVAAGELLRLWAVRHIGAISRTRSDRLGPLVSTGPFGWVRNPLYVANLLLWVGFTLSAAIPWLLPVVLSVLAFAYHAIVRWEETLLESRLGDDYRAYASQVPRWIPHGRPSPVSRREAIVGSPQSASFVHSRDTAGFTWIETLFSERGTLIAIILGYLLLWLKTTGYGPVVTGAA